MSAGGVTCLLDLCTHLVAAHLDCVDSLVGLPELIGETLAHTAAVIGLFNSVNERCLRALQLLNEAYPGKPLSSVSLIGERFFRAWHLPLELVAADLSSVQLIGCRLDSADKLLQQLATAGRVQRLVLRACNLSDTHMQLLTLRARCLARSDSLCCVRVLDVRQNWRLTFVTLKRLLRLRPQILAISLTLTKAQQATVESAGYDVVEKPPAELDPGQGTCDGWLAEVAWQHWIAPAADIQQHTLVARFYGNPASVRSRHDTPYDRRYTVCRMSTGGQCQLFLQRRESS